VKNKLQRKSSKKYQKLIPSSPTHKRNRSTRTQDASVETTAQVADIQVALPSTFQEEVVSIPSTCSKTSLARGILSLMTTMMIYFQISTYLKASVAVSAAVLKASITMMTFSTWEAAEGI
jgi:hypothetical protein